MLIPNMVVFLLSLAFNFSYWTAVQYGPCIFAYSLYFLLMTGAYVVFNMDENSKEPMSFIKTN